MRSRRHFCFLALVFLCCSSAYALPTPDTLISVGQIFLLILSTLFTGLLGLFLKLKSGLSKKSQKQLQNWTLGLGLFCIFQSGALAYLLYDQWKMEQQRAVDLYYRSDLALDALENQAQAEIADWFRAKVITNSIPATELLPFVRDRNPHLLFVNRSKLGYFSGAPGFSLPDGPHVFQALYPSEVTSYLKNLLKREPQALKRPILFISLKPFSRLWPYSKNTELAQLLKQFPGVFYIEYPKAAKDFFTYFMKDPSTQKWIPTQFSEDVFSFSVRKENWFVNQALVAFPNITKLISPRECAKNLLDPNVQILLPFDSTYRPEVMVSYYLGLFFTDAPDIQKRVHTIDWSRANLEKTIYARADFLKDKPFIVAGLSKHDWIYMGLDVAFATHQVSATSFQYLGGCPWFAEAAAINHQAQANKLSLQKSLRRLGQPYRATVRFFIWLSDYSERFLRFPSLLHLLFWGLLFSSPVLMILPSAVKFEEFQRKLKHWLNQNPLEVWATHEKHKKRLHQLNHLRPWAAPVFHLLRLLVGTIAYKVGSNVWDFPLPVFGLVLAAGFVFIRLSINKAFFVTGSEQKAPLITRTSLIIALIGSVTLLLLSRALTSGGTVIFLWTMGIQFVAELFLINRLKLSFSNILPSLSLSVLPKNVFSPHQLENFDPGLVKGGKARHLVYLSHHPWMSRPEGPKAKQGLFSVAKGWLCISPFPTFSLPLKPAQVLVVRSSAALEDTETTSGAGQFLTLHDITEQNLSDAVLKVQNSFAGNGEVLIQEQQAMDVSGVLFTKSLDNPALMQIEWAEGNCVDVVSGKAKVNRISVGRFTGSSLHTVPDPIGEPLLLRLFLLAKALEHYLGEPQDIEWGYQRKSGALFVFQSRPITRYRSPASVEKEQIKLLNALVIRTGSELKNIDRIKLKPADSDEVAQHPSPFLVDILVRVYSTQGSLGIALKALGRPVPHNELFISGFGQLLQFDSKIRSLNFYWKNLKIKKDFSGFDISHEIEFLKNSVSNFSKKCQQASEKEKLAVLQQGLDVFINQIYPQVFKFGLLAKETTRPSISFKLKTKAEELNRDLAVLSPSQIQSKWPHRGPQEYDPIADCFGTSLKVVEESKELFRFWDTQSKLTESPDHPLVLREEAKDWALVFLHQIRLLLNEIFDSAQLAKEFRSLIGWGDLFGPPGSLTDLPMKMRARQGQIFSSQLKIPRPIGFIDLENLYFERRTGGNRTNSSSHQKLVCVGAERELSGALYPLSFDSVSLPPRESIPEGTVLVVETLDPRLAAYFGRVAGFLSARGGSLSHLALLARENDIPIFTGDAVEALLQFQPLTATVTVDPRGALILKENPPASREAA